MNPELTGASMYFFTFSACKEFLTIFFIVTFIGTPVMQLIPSMLMTFVSCLIIALKRPYFRRLDNILNLVVEGAYLLIYIAFLILHFWAIVPENEQSRAKVGSFMIAMIVVIICRCLVDLAVGIVTSVIHIRNYCKKLSRVAPKPEEESPEEKRKQPRSAGRVEESVLDSLVPGQSIGVANAGLKCVARNQG